MQAGEKCLFVVRHQPLVDQTLAYLRQMGQRAGVIKAGYTWDPAHPIQVASLQTLNRRRYWPEADWILLDEAHGCTAPHYDSVFGRYDGATFVGLSATPFLLNRNRPLSTRFEALLASPQVTDLIETGYLVPPVVYGHPSDSLDTRTIRILGGDYDRHELALKCNTPAMTAALVQEWQQRAAGRRTLVLSKLSFWVFLDRAISPNGLVMSLEFCPCTINRELPVNLDALLLTFFDQGQDCLLQLLHRRNASM